MACCPTRMGHVGRSEGEYVGLDYSTFPDIKLLHNRPAGRAYGTSNNWVKNGLANYIAGYHPLFMAVKCLRRTGERPLVTGALGLPADF